MEIEYYNLHSHNYFEIKQIGADLIWEVIIINLTGTDNYQARVIQEELGIKTKWKVVRGEHLHLDTQLMIRKEIKELKL